MTSAGLGLGLGLGLLGAVCGHSATVTLVPSGANWKYNDTGADLLTAWRQADYNDTSWASGPAQLGYGDGDEATVLRSSPVASCYYFRHTFAVTNAAIYTSLSLEVLRDDGCVVYLNGQEVARFGMPAGAVTFDTWASSATEYAWDPPRSIANLLVTGENVIAVEVHQGNSTSTDISLDLRLTATSEISVRLDSPGANATGVMVPAVLQATATDPQDDPLAVSFYGRTAPPARPKFTLIGLPDTQNYTAQVNGGTPAILARQTEWIRNNRDALNIVYVAQFGDVSNNGDSDTDQSEWLNASSALYTLEATLPQFPQGIPYGVAVGNHDQIVPTGDTDPTTFYNQFFGVAHFQPMTTYYGGHYGTRNNNQYHLFSASGLDFIVIYFEYDATPDAAVLEWADGLLKTHFNRRAIVVTHYLLETTAAWGVQGQAIYNALKANPNLFLMLCGHNHGEARRTDVYSDNTVHTLLADYQSYTAGGNGYLRILEFDPDQNQIRVQTYSPWVELYETDSASQFTLDYPMISGPAFTLVQQNTPVASGTPTAASWTDLQPGTAYEWYVTATDGTEMRTSEVRRFTTSANAAPQVALTAPADGALSESGTVALTATASDADGSVVKVAFYEGINMIGEVATEPYACSATFEPGFYTLIAVAYDNLGAQAQSAPVHITVGGAPAAPTNLVATAQSSTAVLLTWADASVNESGFEIYQSTAGSAYTKIGTTAPNVTSVQVTGLQPSTTYTFKVRAVNAAGGADSPEAPVTTPAPPPVPAAPTQFTAAPWSATEILLQWTDNSTDETGFLIERSPDGATWATLATAPAHTGTTAQALDGGLTSGTEYYYRVSACNAVGCSAPTAPGAAAPFIDAYAGSEQLVTGTQTGTRADTLSDNAVYEQLTEKLTGGKPATRYSALEHKWTFTVTPGRSVLLVIQAYQSTSSDGDQFQLAWSTDDVTYQDLLLIDETADSGTYQTATLPATLQGTVYVRVQDTDHTVGKVSLDSLFIDHLFIRTDVSPTMSPPPAPVLKQALAANQSVTLTWEASVGATTYTVWRRVSGLPTWVDVATDLTGLTYTDSGLANGTSYDYVVTAVNTYGESAASSILSATPQAPTITEPPTGLTATGARRKINLTWTQSTTAGVTQNVIYRSGNSGGFTLLATVSATTSYVDAVASGSTWSYYVTAISDSGESAASNVASATAK